MPLTIASTPIGNLKDITLRTLETLKNADLILCEDTRVTQKLLKHYDIQKPLLIYNDFNTPHKRIIEALQEEKNVVLVSDAGTPLMSDPGYKLIQECQSNNIAITAEPGASAIINAIVLSGMPPYPFYFGGFFDPKKSDLSVNATLVFFEAPHRLIKTLQKLKDIPREIAVVREMTKRFEEIMRGSAQELLRICERFEPRGEIVLVFSPILETQANSINIEDEIKKMLEKHSINETAKILSQLYGISKKEVYKKALEISQSLKV
ncbi:MAG: 16S rRNA (cytidine(1402)-2'-O)-methyltransferase [Alphaproteobacteria bacterium]|nr:MAG: 16S rRNA (cytidine(1402)-2'-O)-methyltransferase [Alphaproteobacteria bacterium]